MDSNPQDQVTKRFSAFWIFYALLALAGIASVIAVRRGAPSEEIDAGAEGKRTAILATVREATQKGITEIGFDYKDAQGGHLPTITVPDAVIEKAVAKLKANPAHKMAAPYVGSKEDLARKAKVHDPAESEFQKIK